MDHRSPETAQITAAVAGDRDALAHLLVTHSPALTRRLSARLELNPFADFSLEDALQEVFIDVHRGIATYRVDDGTPFAAWLRKVADHRLAAMLRERSRVKRGGGRKRVEFAASSLESSATLFVQHLVTDEAGTASKIAARQEVIEAVRDGLASLPADQRAAVEQHYLAERTIDATAEAMQKSNGAVRGLLHRARKTMRDVLGESSRWFHRK